MINSDDAPSIMKIGKLVRNFQTRKLEPRETPEASEITAEHRTMEGFYYPINSRQQVGFFLERVLGVQKLWFDGDRPCMPEKRPA